MSLSEAIIFDGMVPEEKYFEKSQRAHEDVRELLGFHTTNRINLPQPRPHEQTNFFTILQQSRDRRDRPHCAAFLVDAVLDALRHSEYNHRTSIVPGEADPFLAQYAAHHPDCTVFTDDSDLFIFPLGDNGRVALLREIDMIVEQQGSDLAIAIFTPVAIARRLGLPDLKALAFLYETEPGITLGAAVQRAKGFDMTARPERCIFSRRYDDLPGTPPFSLDREARVRNVMGQTDPRVAGLVRSMPYPPSQRHGVLSAYFLTLYLPLLLEDPTLKNAWHAGTIIRQMGYSLLAMLDKSRFLGVKEMMRSGDHIGAHAVEQLRDDSGVTALDNLVELAKMLERGATTMVGLPNPVRWRALALPYVLHANKDVASLQLPASEHVNFVWGGWMAHATWAHVHRSAQLQAVLYSFRMLRQIVAVVRALGLHRQYDVVGKLHDCLRRMPGIVELLEGAGRYEATVEGDQKIVDWLELLDLQSCIKADAPLGQGSGSEAGSPPAVMEEGWEAGNPYSLLH